MKGIPDPRTSPASQPRRAVRDRLRGWSATGKRAVVTFVLVGSALFAGQAPSATAAPAPLAPVRMVLPTPGPSAETDELRQLGARLALEYAGAVRAADVESLVRAVSRQLREVSSPPDRLLRTTEAVCRRALTDFLARGVPLPGD